MGLQIFVKSKNSNPQTHFRRKILFIGKANFFAETLLVEATKLVLGKEEKLLFMDGQCSKIKSLFLNRKLSLHEKEEKYRGLLGIRCLVVVRDAFLQGLIALSHALFFSQGDRRRFFKNLLQVKYRNVPVGDCIANCYLRFCNDVLQFDYYYLRTFFQVFKNLSLWDWVIKKNAAFFSKGFFLIPEPVYHDESLRRLFLARGLFEVRQNPASGRLRVLRQKPWGPQIMLNSFLSKKTPRLKLEKIKRELSDLVERRTSYEGMASTLGDIDPSGKITAGPRISTAATIFLHAISDAQYIYGVSCFLDLHDWLICTINICRKLSLPLIIKCHPYFFHPQNEYPLDKKYLMRLANIFGLHPAQLKPGQMAQTKIPGIYFVHHASSPQALVEKTPNLLFLTHHGSIVSEAAFLGKSVIASRTGPYPSEARFLHQYGTVEEYELLIKRWHSGKLKIHKNAKNDLLRWASQRRFYKDYKNHYFFYMLNKYARDKNNISIDLQLAKLKEKCKSKKYAHKVIKDLAKTIAPKKPLGRL